MRVRFGMITGLLLLCFTAIGTGLPARAQDAPPWDPNTGRVVAEGLAEALGPWIEEGLARLDVDPNTPVPPFEEPDPNTPVIVACFGIDIPMWPDGQVCVYIYPDGRVKVVEIIPGREPKTTEMEGLIPEWTEPFLGGVLEPESYDFTDDPIHSTDPDEIKEEIKRRLKPIVIRRVLLNAILILGIPLLRLLRALLDLLLI